MIHAMVFASLLAATASDVPVARVADDARAIDRVAAASKRDLPHDLLRRIVDEDIELLRGHRADGSYAYAGYQRFESGRVSETFSVKPRDERVEISGSYVYRLWIHSPARRLIVAHNRRVFLDHVEIEYLPLGANTTKTQSVKIDAWINPDESRIVELPEIARQATVRVFAHAGQNSGSGNITLSLLQGRVFDNPDSPYADAVASAKAILRGLDHDDVPSIRAMAQRMVNDLQPNGPASGGLIPTSEVYTDLLAVEDLLKGTETERRQGLERLHQLISKVRPASR